MGGDIFIHGKASTVGCIPIGDVAMEELFIMACKAGIQKVKVIISPRDFRREAAFSDIQTIDWAEELYGGIKKELAALPY